MSVKLYYGMRVKDTGKFVEELFQYKTKLINKFLTEQREEIKYKLMHDFVIERVSKGENRFGAILDFKDIFSKNRYIPTLMYEPIMDLEIRMYSNGLIYPNTINQEVLKDILKFTTVEEYGYWDNVDPDDRVSEKDWNRRRLDWESVEDTLDYINIEVYKEVVEESEYYKRYKVKRR